MVNTDILFHIPDAVILFQKDRGTRVNRSFSHIRIFGGHTARKYYFITLHLYVFIVQQFCMLCGCSIHVFLQSDILPTPTEWTSKFCTDEGFCVNKPETALCSFRQFNLCICIHGFSYLFLLCCTKVNQIS